MTEYTLPILFSPCPDAISRWVMRGRVMPAQNAAGNMIAIVMAMLATLKAV